MKVSMHHTLRLRRKCLGKICRQVVHGTGSLHPTAPADRANHSGKTDNSSLIGPASINGSRASRWEIAVSLRALPAPAGTRSPQCFALAVRTAVRHRDLPSGKTLSQVCGNLCRHSQTRGAHQPLNSQESVVVLTAWGECRNKRIALYDSV